MRDCILVRLDKSNKMTQRDATRELGWITNYSEYVLLSRSRHASFPANVNRKQPVETEPNDSSDDREIMNHRLRIEARMSGEPSDG